MAPTVQIIVSLCLAILHHAYGNNANLPSITCCMSGAIPASSPCSISQTTTTTTTTTTPAPFVCPFTRPQSPPAQPEPSAEKPSTGTDTQRKPDPKPAEATPQPNYIPVPVGAFPVVGYPASNTTGNNLPAVMLPPYPILGSPPVVMHNGQGYYLIPNPNKRGNSYAQILNVFNPALSRGFYGMPDAVDNPPVSDVNTEKPKNTNSTA